MRLKGDKMKNNVILSAFIMSCGLFLNVEAGVMPTRKSTLVSIPATFEVKAPINKVWQTLTSVEGFCALSGFKPVANNPTKKFQVVGDRVQADIWGDKGYLIATQINPEQELRVSWEVSDGHYLCHKRVQLKAKGTSTTVEYLDRYSDDQNNVDKTAQDVAKETENTIKAFTTLAEK
jgi:hypothetical protein